VNVMESQWLERVVPHTLAVHFKQIRYIFVTDHVARELCHPAAYNRP